MKKTIKIILIITLLFFYQKSHSQINIGGGFVYGNKIDSFGININGQFFITDDIAISPDFSYYFPNTTDILIGYKRKWYEVNLNGNYYPKLNIVKGKLKPYGLVGVNYSIISYPYYDIFYGTNNDGKVSKIGVNVGAGATFDIGKKIIPHAQIKYTFINSYNQVQLLIGLRYKI